MSKHITTIDPNTGLTLQTYAAWSDAQIEHALAKGHVAARAWGREPLALRISAVRRIEKALLAHKGEMARLITQEMGKPLAEAVGELEKSAVTAQYYANHAEQWLADEPVAIAGAQAWVSYEPIGLVLAVMPWNFPVWQVMRCAIPMILAGNGVVLKHSPNVTGCALALARLLAEAGLPEHLFTALVVQESDVPATIERLIEDDRIAAVTLTGSNRAGSSVASIAGRVVKKTVLELGGSDAFVVLEDADLPRAAAAAVKARFHNAGQSCVCAKRFIVVQAVAERFTTLFLEGVAALKVGDPTDPVTQMGPMARGDLRDSLQSQVDRSVAAGARLLAGGRAVDGPGFFYEPTVLAGVTPGHAVFDEETFGPVAAITVARDEFDAVELANASPFGLSLSLWTASTQRGVRVARGITSGAAFINAITASDARVPFGGTKKSGYGRELAGHGLREFCNIRTYWTAGGQ